MRSNLYMLYYLVENQHYFIAYFDCVTMLEEQDNFLVEVVHYCSSGGVTWLKHVKWFLTVHSVFNMFFIIIAHSVTACFCTFVVALYSRSCLLRKSRGSGYLTVLWRHLEDIWKLWSQPDIWKLWSQPSIWACMSTEESQKVWSYHLQHLVFKRPNSHQFQMHCCASCCWGPCHGVLMTLMMLNNFKRCCWLHVFGGNTIGNIQSHGASRIVPVATTNQHILDELATRDERSQVMYF